MSDVIVVWIVQFPADSGLIEVDQAVMRRKDYQAWKRGPVGVEFQGFYALDMMSGLPIRIFQDSLVWDREPGVREVRSSVKAARAAGGSTHE